jgi:hypothetical protein
MSGRYNDNHHVLTNDEANALSLDLNSTIQCYLHTAGYRTGFYGKFLNGFPILSDQPCLTDYAINRGQQHAGLPVSVNGTLARPNCWLDEFDLRRAKRFLGRVARHFRLSGRESASARFALGFVPRTDPLTPGLTISRWQDAGALVTVFVTVLVTVVDSPHPAARRTGATLAVPKWLTDTLVPIAGSCCTVVW